MKLKSLLWLILFLFTNLLSKNIPVVYVYPFKAVQGVNNSLPTRIYSYFCSSLSSSDRVNLFSEEAWKKIINTEKLLLTINDLRKTETAIELGKLTPVDYIVIGLVDEQGTDVHLHIEWINLHRGLIEKTVSKSIRMNQNLQYLIDQTLKDLWPYIIKDGRIIRQNSKNQVVIKMPTLSGWLPGDEFVLINNLNYGYGRVRLNNFFPDSAVAEIIYLNDKIRRGDRALLASLFRNTRTTLLPAYLPAIEGDFTDETLNELYLNARQFIIESAKFYLIESPNLDNHYYKFRFSLNKEYSGKLILVNLSIIEYPRNKIEYEKNQECVPEDLSECVKLMLKQALNRWEKRALVSRVTDDAIMINIGKNQQVHLGQQIVFKSEENGGVIAQSVVSEVFPNESKIEKPEGALTIRTGMIVAFAEPEYSDKWFTSRFKRIKERVNEIKKSVQEEHVNQLKAAKIRQEKEKLKNQLKSRIRVGYSLPIAKSRSDDHLYNFKRSPKMDVDFYLGSYPYFNLILNYEYHHLEYKQELKKIFINTFGTGLKLQSPALIGHFSLYGIALYQYSFLSVHIPASFETPSQKLDLRNQYFTIRSGLDIKLDSGFAVYLEVGEKRILKYQDIKLQYFVASAGISLWF